jgi:hypothetical protein
MPRPILILPILLLALACAPAARPTAQHVPVQFKTVDVPDCDPRKQLSIPGSWEEADPDNEQGMLRTIRSRTGAAVSICAMFRPATPGAFPILLVARLDKPLAASTVEEAEKRFEPLRMAGLNMLSVSLDPGSRLVRAQLKDAASGYLVTFFVPDNSSTALLFVSTETAAREHESTMARIARSFR